MSESPPDAPGGPTPAQRKPSSKHGSLTVALVAALAGALFATNATLFRSGAERHPQDLAELVSNESARLTEVADEVEDLRAQVTDLIERESGQGPAETPDTPSAVASGAMPVQGPGIVVRLWDAPQVNVPDGVRPDDLVVHQQDLEAVMNALWAGGAEAMTVQDNRVTAVTAVRCVGNVLLMTSRTYSPPYEVAAIGDPEDLSAALDASPAIQIYLQYVRALGLGWSVEQRATLDMPAAQSRQDLAHAHVISTAEATDTLASTRPNRETL